MHTKYDVVVVGAGPAGSIAARTAAERGLKTLLLEKRQEIGSPVRCAEAISHETLIRYIEPEAAWISATVHGGRIFSPNGTPVVIQQPNVGYVLERKLFDRRLAETAVNAGAEVLVKARVTGVINTDDQICGVTVRYHRRDHAIQADIVIAADGVESQVARWAGINSTHELRDVDICAQYLMSNLDPDVYSPEYCDFYIGRELAPRGYVWVFPKGPDLANVGVGIGGTISGRNGKLAIDYLNDFVRTHFPEGRVLSQVAGCVPVGDSLPEIVGNGLMIVGDAAHHSDPISGGGIANAMISGHFAAETAADAIAAGDLSAEFLRPYPERWDEEIGKNFRHICRIRDGVMKFSDKTFDRCAQVLNKLSPEKITMREIFKTVLLHQPRLLLELRHLIAPGWI